MPSSTPTVPEKYRGTKAQAWMVGYTRRVKRLPGMTVGMGSESEACADGYYAATGEQSTPSEPLYPDGASAPLSLDAQIEQTAARLESSACQDRVTDHERLSRSLAEMVALRQAQGHVALALPAKESALPSPPRELHIVIEPLCDDCDAVLITTRDLRRGCCQECADANAAKFPHSHHREETSQMGLA